MFRQGYPTYLESTACLYVHGIYDTGIVWAQPLVARESLAKIQTQAPEHNLVSGL